jgi:adenylyltransferase/sulfurtransferase
VLCIGTGGLGSPIALYLAAAGVGRIGMVDGDVVDFSNLQRQILHGTKDVGRKKLNSARDRIRDVNPNVQVDLYDTFFTSGERARTVRALRLDHRRHGQFSRRAIARMTCRSSSRSRTSTARSFASMDSAPSSRRISADRVIAACSRTAAAGHGAELRGRRRARRAAGIIGVMQAIEAVKLIIGIGEPLIGRMIAFDALKMKFREFKLRRDPKCPVCGENPTITELIDYDQFCGIPEANKAAEEEAHVPHISVPGVERESWIAATSSCSWMCASLTNGTSAASPARGSSRLGNLPARLSELDSADEIVLQCKSGARSAKALHLLQEAGFGKLANVEGGICGLGGAHRSDDAEVLSA